MIDGTGLRVALGVAAGLGLGAFGVLVLPAVLVPSGERLAARTDAELAASLEAGSPEATGVLAPAAPAPSGASAATEPAPLAGTPGALAPADAAADAPTGSAAEAETTAAATAEAEPEAVSAAGEPPSDADQAQAAEPPVPADPAEPLATGAAPDALAPGLDTVRVHSDGNGLVAGRAAPGTRVEILVDGAPVAEAVAEADGAFVAFLEVPPSDAPRAISLRDAEGRASDETVILAPIPAPPPAEEQVATLGPAAVPALPGTDPATAASSEAGSAGEAAGSLLPDPSTAPDPSSLAATAAIPSPVGPAASGTLARTAAPGAAAGPAAVATAAAAPSAVADPTADGPRAALAPPTPASADDPAALAPEVEAQAPGLAAPEPGPLAQPPILVSDANGVRVLQPALGPGADPDTLASVALDSVAYGGTGEPVLSGRASGGTLRLYLDNAPVAEVAVGADSTWTMPLPEAEPGTVHALRLDQLDAEGNVVSRIETPFQREGRDSLEAAMAEAGQAGQEIAVRVVQPGNTLWAIARDRYGEPLMYLRVFEANRDRIRDADLIYPGQVFVLPATDGR